MSCDLLIISKVVERKIIFGDMKRKQAVKNHCIEHGFKIVHDGAKPIGLKKYCDKEFKLIVERDIKKGTKTEEKGE
jgi:hypothetical protein